MPSHRLNRRDFIRLLGGMAGALPMAARAQLPQRKHGVLLSVAESDPDGQTRTTALLQGLQELGWHDGQNLHIDFRWSAGRVDLNRQYAREMVALAPDILLASGTGLITELKSLTRSIPIVCALVIDPVGLGLVESLARPGGNITGFTFINVELFAKWASLLKDAAPATRRAALLYNPRISPFFATIPQLLAALPSSIAMEIVPAPVETADALRPAIEAQARIPGSSLIIGPDAFLVGQMPAIGALAKANRLPGISVYRRFATEGGLMAYGPDVPDIFRRSAGYIDRILRGANPADLPVQQPAKYEFTINQKAADTLGLALPANLLARADEVIE